MDPIDSRRRIPRPVAAASLIGTLHYVLPSLLTRKRPEKARRAASTGYGLSAPCWCGFRFRAWCDHEKKAYDAALQFVANFY
ncbi:hypothetical protein P3T18_006262 [Paraburkholderia sp. GAS199]|uniref:hypothetical protein n=1 Tax=Paraburkholderia sp. GAS199 TaxID=3035126 RepID=UPI003D22B00A